MSRDRWLFLFLKSVPCSSRCKHCDFAVSSNFPSMPIEQTIEFIDPFVKAKENQTVPFKNMAVLVGDAPLNYPQLADCTEYMKKHDVEGWYSIPANGFRSQRLNKWWPFLESIRQVGTEIFEFTLYGKQESHDWFANRKGEHEAIHQLAKMWIELGGKTIWSVVIHKRNLDEIEEIRRGTADTYGQSCSASLWSYLGHGAQIEQLRLDRDDLDRIDGEIREDLKSVKSEREWIAQMGDSEEVLYPKEPFAIRVVVDHAGQTSIPYTPPVQGHQGIIFGNLPAISVENLLESWSKVYGKWCESFPNLKEICQKYGDTSCTKLHTLESIKAKWSHQHQLQNLKQSYKN